MDMKPEAMLDANDCTLNELLEEQLKAMQRAMALNQAVSSRLKQAGGGEAASSSKNAHPVRIPAGKPAQDKKSPLINVVCCSRRSPQETKVEEKEGAPDEQKVSAVKEVQAVSEKADATTTTDELRAKLEHVLQRSSQSARDHGDLHAPLLDKSKVKDRGLAPKQAPDMQKGVFPNKDEVRAQLKGFLRKRGTEVRPDDENFADNWFSDIARDSIFKNTTFVMIFLNTLWIAYDTDHNHADTLAEADAFFVVVENLFCFFFTFELTVRLFAYRHPKFALEDGWFLFDAFLVMCMIWETWICVFFYYALGFQHVSGGAAATVLRIFRLARLARVARVGRLVRNVPELLFLVKGLWMALRSVVSTLALMFIVIYIFAIMFTQLLSKQPIGEEKFETVPQSINYLMLAAVFPDQQDFLNELCDIHWFYYAFYAFYLLIGSLTIMNMLIGVICEVVAKVAEAEQLELAEDQLKEKIRKTLPGLDEDADNKVSKAEFASLMQHEEAMEALEEVGVDVMSLLEYADVIWQEDNLPFEDFLSKVLEFRESGNTTRHGISAQMKEFEERITAHISETSQPLSALRPFAPDA